MNLALWPKKKTQDDSLSKEKFKTKKNKQKASSSVLRFLQDLGKALQFPIAVLPFAAVLNRFGALGITYTTANGVITNQVGYWVSFIIQSGGAVVFGNLALFFAIGVAFGFAKDHRGEVALVGALFYLALMAMTSVEHSLPEMIYKNVLTFTNQDGQFFSWLFYVPIYDKENIELITGGKYVLDIGVLGGITAGALSAMLYNKYKDIKLTQALSFFGGRRFVPMVALLLVIPVGLLFAIVWPWVQYGLIQFGTFTSTHNSAAIPLTGVYAIFNRALLPFGLHQILNTLFWFQLPVTGDAIAPITGDVIGQNQMAMGDIAAFTLGIVGSGIYQTGFFPIMMGGIPAIAIAMIFTAHKENRSKVAGFLGGVALVSFVSGITEPIEFSFAFIAPLLYGVHAILTGVFMMITTAMGIQVGFGFSAGLIDYCVSFAQSWGFASHKDGAAAILANPLWILLLTAGAGLVYFVVFYTLITKLNIQTPGREKINLDADVNLALKENVVQLTEEKKEVKKTKNKVDKYSFMATEIIGAIGEQNFVSVDNCATRLRLVVKDTSKIDQAKIKAAGAYGIITSTNQDLQVVIGSDVEHVTNIIKERLKL